jgi:hypothetical protein
VGGGQRVRQIDAVPTGGPVFGLRVAIGAGLLAVGWLVLGSVAGGASATELEIGDGSLLGPDSSLTVVTEPIQDAGSSDATPGADAAPAVAGLSILSDVADVATQPVLESIEPVLETVEPVLQSVEQVLDTVEPVLQSVGPVVNTVESVVEPVLESVEPVLGVSEPALDSVEPVLKTLGAEATAFGTQAESIQVAPKQLTHAPRDSRSTVPSAAAVALADPAPHAPAPFAPLAPLIPMETVAPGASGSTALLSDVAERGWVPCSPVAYTMPPGNDIPPAAPAFDSDSTPD